MQSRWISAVLTASLLCASACATSIDTNTTTQGAGAGPGTGGNGAGGNGGSGGGGPCTSAEECVAFTDSCNTGTCINGECGKFPANEDTPCDDGLLCTLTEACKAGVCTAISEKFCPASDSCHVGTCDLETDTCTVAPGNDGAGCIDADPCTLTGVCNAGVCSPGQAVDCSFLDSECGFGTCDPQIGCKVVAQNDGFPCEDGLFCTDFDECTAGACNGVPKECAPPGNVCLTGTCDEFSNTCIATPGNDGAACDDGNLCSAGETCAAGACIGGGPTNDGAVCDDANGCTGGTSCLNGTCSNPTSEIVACIDNDVCCPVGCPNDTDCSIDVALIYVDDFFFVEDVRNNLLSTGEFTTVDLIDAEFSSPTAAQLAPYKAVLVWSDPIFYGPSFGDPFTLGNTLADYFDAGGRVVLTTFGNCNNSQIQGRFVSDGYQVLGFGDPDFMFPVDSLGSINEPGSPLVAGVDNLSASFAMRCAGFPVNGGTTVATWSSGLPLIVRGTIQGRNRVDVNLFPPSSNVFPELWVGDGTAILANALLFQ